jgi:hydroxyacylglutathione hydrolase
MLIIEPIAAFSDNYIWLFYQEGSNKVGVVDPGDAAPVKAVLEERGLDLAVILITHHHFDHVGGLLDLRSTYSPIVYGPHNPSIEGIEQKLAAGESIEVFDTRFNILEVPGHTLDHIAYFTEGHSPIIFCGDTLFAGGCGRLFEGDAPMMLQSLDSIAALAQDTRIYCAHEYTLGNLAFAKAVEPENTALLTRIAEAEATRARNEPTVPSTLALELATNPFLRSRQDTLKTSLVDQGKLAGDSPEQVFASVRGWKDDF